LVPAHPFQREAYAGGMVPDAVQSFSSVHGRDVGFRERLWPTKPSSLSENESSGDGKKYPDVLVFDRDYNLKFALDGNPADSEEKQGYMYPWSRSHFEQICPRSARVKVDVEIAPDDIVYWFYFYEELDLIYTALDINPFTKRTALSTFFHSRYGFNPRWSHGASAKSCRTPKYRSVVAIELCPKLS
jgi:hypothetical protein